MSSFISITILQMEIFNNNKKIEISNNIDKRDKTTNSIFNNKKLRYSIILIKEKIKKEFFYFYYYFRDGNKSQGNLYGLDYENNLEIHPRGTLPNSFLVLCTLFKIIMELVETLNFGFKQSNIGEKMRDSKKKKERNK